MSAIESSLNDWLGDAAAIDGLIEAFYVCFLADLKLAPFLKDWPWSDSAPCRPSSLAWLSLLLRNTPDEA